MKFRNLILITALFLAAPVATAVQPDNVTLKLRLEADKVFVDGSEVKTDSYTVTGPDFPYIASEQNPGIVGRGSSPSISYRNLSRDVFSVTSRKGSFLVPFTHGGYRSIERREKPVKDRTFLSQVEPSFGFHIPDEPVVRASYRFQQKISGFQGNASSIEKLTVQNRPNGENFTELKLESE